MNRIVGLRNILLAIAVVAVVVCIPLSERLEFDQRLESFFADDHPDIVILHRSREEFGGDEFVIVAWTEPQLLKHDLTEPPELQQLIDDRAFQPELTQSARERIVQLSERLNEIDGVDAEQTQSLASFFDNAPRIRTARRAMLQLFVGTLIGEDARTTSVVLTLLPESESPISRASTLQQIRAVANAFETDSAVAGEPVQIHDMFRLVEEDSRVLFLASLAILGAVLLVLFRGLRWMLGAVGLVLGVVICTRAILVLAGSELSMVGSMLNSLVTVIGIATCMHVIVYYRDLRAAHERNGTDLSAQEAAVRTLQHLAAPVFWTCLTTAVGFGSLMVSQITPVRSFSLMMSLATAVIIVACVLVLPAMLASGPRLKNPAVAPLEHWLDRALSVTCHWLDRHPGKTAAVFCLAMLLCIPAIFDLRIETDFSRNFRESSSIVQSLRFIESRLGAAGTWEVAFDTPEELDDLYLEQAGKLTEQLKATAETPADMRVISLADVADLPPRMRGRKNMLDRMQRTFPTLVAGMHNDELNRMRIVLRSMEQQPAEDRAAQIELVRHAVSEFSRELRELQQSDPEEGAYAEEMESATASGMFVLLTGILQSLLQDQLRSFLCATAGIFVCMTVAFRSLRIGLISLFPNVFPVALLLGSLGWLDVPVNIGTAMIASVSMGLTVDSTIHYIFAFERARQHQTVSQAVQEAHAGAGRAVVFAHLALIAGFAVLAASRFIPLVYFGALMSLSMFWGVFGDLVLLPLLLRWTTPETPAEQLTDSASVSHSTRVAQPTKES